MTYSGTQDEPIAASDAAGLTNAHTAAKAQHFLPGWVRRVLRKSTWLHDQYTYWTQVRRLLSYVNARNNFFKIPTTSKDIYDSKDDYEHRDYETGSTLCRVDNRIVKMSHREIRDHYCEYLFREIDALLADKPKLRILEIGCGNCINLMLLKKHYGDRVQLAGYDISAKRLEVARGYFGTILDDVELRSVSVTDPVPEDERGRFDLVFSMHCLEQIPFAVQQAVQGMHDRSSSTIVMIEPVFEFARPEQKLFLIYSDFVRTLLPTIRYLGYRVVRAEPLPFESSIKNQSSLIVIRK